MPIKLIKAVFHLQAIQENGGPEHIKPMMAGEISLKLVKKPDYIHIGTTVSTDIHDIIFRNSVTNSAFTRAAILEKIKREGLV